MIAISEKIRQVSLHTIADIIRDKKCILFLGPNLFMSDEFPEKTRQNVFFDTLYKKNPDKILAFFPNDDLLLFKNQYARMDVQQNIKEHFSTTFESELITKILEIPFHLIVNLSSYSCFHEVAKVKNFDVKTETFNIADTNKLSFDPTLPDTPALIYNILGDTTNYPAMVLSHTDLFTYINSVFDEKRFPKNLGDLMESEMKTNVLLFLGVDFTKWYTQLMLSNLKIPEKRIRYASGQNMLHEQFELCKNGLNIEFVTDNAAKFVHDLHNLFSTGGELRTQELLGKMRNAKHKNFRKLLNATFQGSDGDAKLKIFCDDDFPQVSDKFISDQSRDIRIDFLLKYVKEHRQYEQLLENIAEYNPTFIADYETYFED